MAIKNEKYSKKILLTIKVFSVIAVFILICASLSLLLRKTNLFTSKNLSAFSIITLITNLTGIVCFSILFFRPEKFGLIAIMAFIYAVIIFINEPNNLMGMPMAFLCFDILCVRNFFNKNKKIKIFLFWFILFALLFTQIRFKRSIFIESFLNAVACFFVLAASQFFYKEKIIIELNKTLSNRTLNLFDFPGTKAEDIPLLEFVLENKQYKEIAKLVFRAEGTVRNRLNKLYDILGVADRIGFISTYFGYKVIFEEYKIEQNNKPPK